MHPLFSPCILKLIYNLKKRYFLVLLVFGIGFFIPTTHTFGQCSINDFQVQGSAHCSGTVNIGAFIHVQGNFSVRYYTKINGMWFLQQETPTPSWGFSSYNAPITATTTYGVSIYNHNSWCESPKKEITLSPKQPAPGGYVRAQGYSCSSGHATIQASSSYNVSTYRLYRKAGGQYYQQASSTTGTFTLTNFYDNTPTSFPMPSNYYVRIFPKPPCRDVEYTRVSIYIARPAAPVVSGNTDLCVGGSTTLTAIGGSNGNYRWYKENALIPGTPGTQTQYNTGALTGSTNFQVSKREYTYFDNEWCEGPKRSVQVVVQNPAPPTPFNKTVCGKDNVVLTTNNFGFSKYRWYDQHNNLLGTTDGNFFNTSSENLTSYKVKVQDDRGCWSDFSASGYVTSILSQPPIVSQWASCGAGASVRLTVAYPYATGGDYYVRWYTSSTSDIAEHYELVSWGDGGSTYETPPLTGNRDYWVEISRPGVSHTCRTERVHILAETGSTPIIGASGYSCENGTAYIQAYGDDVVGGYSLFKKSGSQYEFVASRADGSFTLNDFDQIEGSYQPKPSDYYIQASVSGCDTRYYNVDLQVFRGAAPSVTGNTEVCIGKTTTLTASGAQSGSFYQWYLGDDPIDGANGAQFTTGPIFEELDYHVSYIQPLYVGNNLSCESPKRKVNIKVLSNSPPEVIGLAARCGAGTLTLEVEGQFESAQWYNPAGSPIPGATSAQLEITKSQLDVTEIYKAKVFFANGCESDFLEIETIARTNCENYIHEALVLVPGIIDESKLETLTLDQKTDTWNYFDGLGRPKQTVLQQSSPGKNDHIQPIVYDAFGREKRAYLPYVVTPGTAGFLRPDPLVEQANFYQSAENVAHDTKPWADKVYEPSPLNRVLKQGAAGAAWQPNPSMAITSDKVVRHGYEVNHRNDDVLIWNVTPAGHLEATGYYPTGQLTKTITKDEEGHAVIEFVDKEDHVRLKRVQAVDNPSLDTYRPNDWANTYYIVDDLGNTRYVLPPEAVAEIGNSIIFPHTPSTGLLDRWAFQYRYDSRRRVVEKSVPGAEPVYMVYDDRDRLVLTQDGEQRTGNEWLFTKYDALNRPVLTGIHDTTLALSQGAMQSVVDAHYQRPSSSFYETLTGDVHGYTNASYPVQADENRYLSVTYYDNYGFQGTVPGFGSTFNYQAPTVPPNCQTIPQGTYCYEGGVFDRVKGQVTGTKTRVLGTDQWSYTVTHYDDRYRVIQIVQVNEYQNSRERTSNLYSFSGWLLETYRDHTKGLQSHGLRNRYEYDHAGRLLKAYHEVFDGGSGQGEVLLSQHHYNELGELVTKKLHKVDQSAAYVQADPLVGQANVHYDGQIVSGNYQGERAYIATESVKLTPGFRVPPGTEFTARIGYSQQDAEAFNNQVQVEEYFAQEIDYRYNIRGWLTHINEASLTGSLGDTNQPKDYWGMELGYNNTLTGVTSAPAYNGNISAVKWSDGLGQRTRAYAYAYDPMNRITDADHSIVGQANTAAFDVTIRDGMNPGYDLNGNILKLSRGGLAGAGMDILTYNYGTGNTRGNQLLSVTDDGDETEGFKDGTHTGDDYLYDDNGNMTRDLNKDINAITYNHLNLPETVTKADGSYIKYIYDAAGVKLAQEVYDASNALTKKTDYLDGFIYENDELQLIQHEEGRIVPDATTGNFDYQYHLKDHLGNTRLTFTTEPKEIIFSVNYENDADNPDDIALFEGVSISDMEEFNHTQGTYTDDTPYSHAQVLKSSPHHQVGSVIALPVGKGDEINARVFGKYVDANADPNVPAITLATALVSAFTGVAVGATDNGVSTINNNFDAGTLIGSAGFPYNSQAPKAYLNLLFLPGSGTITLVKDETFAYKQLHQNAKEDVVGDALKDPFDELLIENFKVPGNGYVLIYVSNEGALNDVFFDDLEIRINEHPVIQRDDFYPFGLTFNSFQRITVKKNDFLFNGIERETELDLGWDVAEYRSYDPAIGRWLQIDPKASERESPYVGFGNRPNFFIDPLGDTVRLITENDPRTNDGATYATDEVVVTAERLPNGNPWEGFKEGWSVFKDDDNSTDEKIEIPLAGEGNTNTSRSGLEEGIEVVGDDGGNNAEQGNGEVFYEVSDHMDKVGNARGFFTPSFDFSDTNTGDSSVTFWPIDDYPTVRPDLKGGGFGTKGRAIKSKKDSANTKHKWKLGNKEWKGF